MPRTLSSPVLMIVYGFLLWLITFLVSWAIYPLKGESQLLFDSLMPVAIAALTMFFLYLYFKGVPSGFFTGGLIAGIAWLVMNLLLDQLLFSWGPMQMSFIDYMYDIGFTYLMIPFITGGAGLMLDRLLAQRKEAR